MARESPVPVAIGGAGEQGRPVAGLMPLPVPLIRSDPIASPAPTSTEGQQKSDGLRLRRLAGGCRVLQETRLRWR